MMNSLKSWLTYPNSLTNRLKEKAGEASLQVLAQGFGETSSWEMQRLNIPAGRVWRREIIMSAKGEPCWYACSIVPEATYVANQAFFEKLKTQSLNDLIYNSPIIQRVSLVNESVDQFNRATSVFDSPAWGHLSNLRKATMPFESGMDVKPSCQCELRLSTFMLFDQWPFYLVEQFLPAIERYCD